MSQAMITIAAPLRSEDVLGVRTMIEDRLGNPARDDVAAAIEGPAGSTAFVHFASMHAVPRSDGTGGHLVFEFTADGSEDDVLSGLAARVDAVMTPIFSRAKDWRSTDTLLAYWKRHRVPIGWGLFDTPGLAFAGTPGMDVARIRREADLAGAAATILATCPSSLRALERLDRVRTGLAADPKWRWALGPPPAPPQTPAASGGIGKYIGLIPSFLGNFFWPVFLVFGILAGLSAIQAPSLDAGLLRFVTFLWNYIPTALLVVILGLVAIYITLTGAEARDWTANNAIRPDVLDGILVRENQPGFAQNHMVSITTLKPGFVRQLTIRLAFWVIANFTALNPKPGHLGDIGTIHFARWVKIPGTRDFFFFSNFGGSWESYLEDFITRAHQGLTGVWSNTVGFPRTENLFFKGATDGERFKRFARASMVHTPFWFNAYPTLTTDNIRSNEAIRRGIGAVLTDEEAIDWLARFASAIRPIDKIESSEVQSLVFGGLGFMPFGTAIVMKFGDDKAANRRWLAEVLPKIAFNDGRRLISKAVATLAIGPGGFERLGLTASALETFPAAFLQGMTGPGRDRILGDFGGNAVEHWWWGQDADHAALLVYGSDEEKAFELAQLLIDQAQAAGHHGIVTIPLEPVPRYAGDRKEPFGFVDGTSQPVIRGTYRGLRNGDPIHLVEPGEFILGYPDNRGNLPPGPHMAATLDPAQCLPISTDCSDFGENFADADRDIGRNGSFLVIRQLEQDVAAFETYCEQEATRLDGTLPEPYRINKEFIAAKMIGRWRDGSSIARFPYLSASTIASENGVEAVKPMARPMASPGGVAAAIAPPPGLPEAKIARAASGPVNTIAADNDFLFGTEDPEGLRCPFGAHIRRANPRDSLDPGSQDQIDISNRHRIIRIGRGYKPADGQKPGLLFMCLNGDIERQFEFIQQTWLASPKFLRLNHEVDPIVVDGVAGTNGFTIPTRTGPIALSPMQRFVTTRGGGYFFLPSKRLLTYLSSEMAPR
jgi:deferrochelatase/peroxidase EfeB